jgi:helix-turn-helix protein
MSWQAQKRVWALSGNKGSALLLLLAIADYTHEDGTNCFASVATLAKKVRLSPREVRRLINETLVPSGELHVQKREGTTSMLTVLVRDDGDTPAIRDTPVARDTPVIGDTPRRTSATTTHATGDTPPLTPMTPEPLVNPADPADEPGESSLDDAEGRAERLWLDERRRHGHEEKFTDRAALRVLREGVHQAYGFGATTEDVETAIREHAQYKWSDTREACSWVVSAMDTRERHERDAQKMRERLRQRREDDDRIEAEWQVLQRQHPGLTRAQIAQRRVAGA